MKESNPDASVSVVITPDQPGSRSESWRNSDRALREWWRQNRTIVAGERIAVIEWDTLVCCPFPELPDGSDLAGAQVIRTHAPQTPMGSRQPGWTSDNWFWWRDLPKLGVESPEGAVGLVSFGCYLMRREVLEAIALPRWDTAFAASIQNELRFPTLAQMSGFSVGEVDLPHVRHHGVQYGGKPGIYHSVKTSILQNSLPP